MAHPVLHIEFSANNPSEMANWYSNLFGWKVQDWPQFNYSTATWAEGQSGAGFSPITEMAPAGTVIAYIHSDDVPADLARIAAVGGTVLGEPMDLPDVGIMAYFRDPTGNISALLKPVMPAG